MMNSKDKFVKEIRIDGGHDHIHKLDLLLLELIDFYLKFFTRLKYMMDMLFYSSSFGLQRNFCI